MALLELVETVESGDFICFGKGWIVEHCVAKIFDSATVSEDGLADVDDFRCALAYGVYTQKLAGIAVKEKL